MSDQIDSISEYKLKILNMFRKINLNNDNVNKHIKYDNM